MLNIIFVAALIWVTWKLFVFGIKAAWGIAKVVCAVVLFPVVLVGLVCIGLVYIVIPILV